MHKPTVKGEIPIPSEDHHLVLDALGRLEGQIGRGATRAEIKTATGRPDLDISAILGSLHIAGFVLCEGTAGYPPAPCWRVKN